MLLIRGVHLWKKNPQ